MPEIDVVFECIAKATAQSDAEALQMAAYDLETLLMYGDSAEATEIVERAGFGERPLQWLY